MSRVPVVTHPGKIGDLIYALPVAAAIAEKHGETVRFLTSPLCEPVVPLLITQPFVRSVHVASDYKMEHAMCGVQPWEMPLPEDYDGGPVYHLGLRGYPRGFMTDVLASYYGLAWDTGFRLSQTKRTRKSYLTVHNFSTQPGNVYPHELMQEVLKGVRERMYLFEGRDDPGELYRGLANLLVVKPPMDMTADLIGGSALFVGCLSSCSVIAGWTGTPSIVIHNHPHLEPFAFRRPDVKYLYRPHPEHLKNAIKEALDVKTK